MKLCRLRLERGASEGNHVGLWPLDFYCSVNRTGEMMVDATHLEYAVFEFKMSEQESRMPAARTEERAEKKSGVMLVS